MNKPLSPAEGLTLRAGMYQLLAWGYLYPNQSQRQRVLDLAGNLAPWAGLISPDWAGRISQLRDSAASMSETAAEAEFNHLFSGAMAAAPYETAYEPDIFQKQHALADIAGFYRAFGFQVPDQSRWQPDHVGVQLEYCSILLQRMAYAVQQGWEEQAAVCADGLRKFLLGHLGRWSAAFADDLANITQVTFYRDLANATREWVELELAALGLAPDRLRSRQVYSDDLDLPVCGGCTGCGPAGQTQSCPVTPARS